MRTRMPWRVAGMHLSSACNCAGAELSACKASVRLFLALTLCDDAHQLHAGCACRTRRPSAWLLLACALLQSHAPAQFGIKLVELLHNTDYHYPTPCS